MKNICYSAKMLLVGLVAYNSASIVFANPLTKVLGEVAERVMKKSAKEGGEKALKEGVESTADTVVTKTIAHGSPLPHPLPGSMIPESVFVKRGPLTFAEFQIRNPELATSAVRRYGDDVAQKLVREVPVEELPRLMRYMDAADSPQTRELLLGEYHKQGPSIFQRLPPAVLLAGGLSASMIYGTHRVTEPFHAFAEKIRESSSDDALGSAEWLLGRAMTGSFILVGLLIFGLLGLHLKKRRKSWIRHRREKKNVFKDAKEQ